MNQSTNVGHFPVNHNTLASPGSPHLLDQGQGLYDTVNRQRTQDTQDVGEIDIDPADWNVDDWDVDNANGEECKEESDDDDEENGVTNVLYENTGLASRVPPASQQLPQNQDQTRSVVLENQNLAYEQNRAYPSHQQLPRNQGQIGNAPLNNQILGYGDTRGNQGYRDNRGYGGYPGTQQFYRDQVPFQNPVPGYGDRIELTSHRALTNDNFQQGGFNLCTVGDVLICNFRAISAV